MTEKHLTHWRVKSPADLNSPWEWEQLEAAPTTAAHPLEPQAQKGAQMTMLFYVDPSEPHESQDMSGTRSEVEQSHTRAA